MTETYPVMPGAEPYSFKGGADAVLVVHGFTGSPQSMRPLAEAFAEAGFTVELPLLPGHGTSVQDMLQYSWAEWSAAAEEAYQELAARSEKVVVAGLSMGGAISAWLATRHPEIAGIVLVNPAAEPVAPEMRAGLREALDSGVTLLPGVGSDIAEPGRVELAYDEAPVAGMLSMLDALDVLAPALPDISCPVLLMNSPQDHVLPPSHSDLLASMVSGPVERVSLDRSYHVATLDYDAAEIEARAVEFARKVTAPS